CEQEKQDGSGHAGLSDKGEAGDHENERCSKWNGCKHPSCESEQDRMADARHHVGCAEHRSFRQPDQNKAVDGCTYRNNGFFAETLGRWAEESIGDDSALFSQGWTIPIREEQCQYRECKSN